MKPLLCLSSLICLAGQARAYTYTVWRDTVGSANIFAAGRETALEFGGGDLPSTILLEPGLDRTLQVGNVFGSTHNAGGSPIWGPDGFSISVNINPVGGISGLYAGRAMALLGVFLDDHQPDGSPPPTIDFTSTTGITRNFRTLAPENGQVFLIGDGWASVSEQQVFYIPDNATRLFLGFADAGNFQGNAGTYSDNTGSLSGILTFTVPVPVPEPTASVLAAAAAAGVMLWRRRRWTAIPRG